ncbi:MAG TPA: proline--tRNA ligase [Candidatus Eisenbergiella stercorigallinarum]|uniref:Proline--tRNA ligase n=1 Tax=Candidatus Eisenbergiella stercorigallinarum TaxID=2838557 RepID=A0A9D2TYG3_9FIRM|nr:proline--tRNA ligase [Candidatus Eisenbergiella stercorigallinarum]
MKLSKLVGDRFKETPSDCVAASHALMLRGGYMKYVANGIYSSLPPLKRITKKIEEIIREEMDALEGQEVSFPVALPASLWEESGRYASVGSELLRFTDRNGAKMVLGMTHEEAAVQLVREYASTYSRYPFMIYQIQTKFRDEARPRAGLIRVREFTMKDAYSFHTSQEDLENYYARCLRAYQRIFARAGIPEVVCVASDSGMMGGNLSHEFMLLTPAGEDSIVLCLECGYSANMEAAECIYHTEEGSAGTGSAPSALLPVETPGVHTIEELADFLHIAPSSTCKAVVYQKNRDDSYVVLFLRGDLEVNEAKLTSFLGEDIHPAVITEESGLQAGFIGPVSLRGPEGTTVLFDRSLEGLSGLACGANREGWHMTGLDLKRDCPDAVYRDFAKASAGGICPVCGRRSLTISRGIEVGNIFQLGDKYTRSMHMQYVDEKGNSHTPIMGCYGIGVGRLAASVCEAKHDDYGPVWPISIAPWQVHLCCMRGDNAEVRAQADRLYEALQKAGVEVLYDDRNVSAGVMFSDADLLGVPVRLVASPRNRKEGCVELSLRGDRASTVKLPEETAVDSVLAKIRELAEALEAKVPERI